MELGKRILILGVSASGKSTFARALANKIHLPLTLMDSIMWKPGWQYVGDEDTVKKLDEISSQAEWIIEGYISTNARAFVLERADTIIYLDYPSHVSSWRYIKRWLKHRKSPRLELEGSPEKFSFKFLRLVWTKGEVWRLKPLLKEESIQSKTLTFHSPKQTDRYLKSLQ